MTWTIEFTEVQPGIWRTATASFQRRIFRFLEERIGPTEDPRRLGRILVGDRGGFWRFRVGDYRLICGVDDARRVVTVYGVGHRREVYRNRP